MASGEKKIGKKYGKTWVDRFLIDKQGCRCVELYCTTRGPNCSDVFRGLFFLGFTRMPTPCRAIDNKMKVKARGELLCFENMASGTQSFITYFPLFTQEQRGKKEPEGKIDVLYGNFFCRTYLVLQSTLHKKNTF